MATPHFSPDGAGVEALVQDLLEVLGSAVLLSPEAVTHIRNTIRLAHARGRLHEFEEGSRCLRAGRGWAWKGEPVPEMTWVTRRPAQEECDDGLH